MADESDGIEEALEAAVRLAVMAGARLGSEIARARDERLREQRRLDERDGERLAHRLEAEKRAAVAELSQVHRPEWWERADAERIADVAQPGSEPNQPGLASTGGPSLVIIGIGLVLLTAGGLLLARTRRRQYD